MEYDYQVSGFNGPLDLLLHLIREHDMDLLDLDVAAVCDQYLAYIETMDPSMLERMAEYLVMAGWLIEMKSRLLLPRTELDDEEDDYEEKRQAMIQRLLEKNQINSVLNALNDAYEERQSMYSKLPTTDEFMEDIEAKLPDDLEVYDLLKAMQKVMKRQAMLHPLETKVARVEITIEERTAQIRDYFNRHKGERIAFDDLFDQRDRYFMIVTFMSILTLAKDKEITITQDKSFDTIYLKGIDNG